MTLRTAALATLALLFASLFVRSAEPARVQRVEPAGARCGFTAVGNPVHTTVQRGEEDAKVTVNLYCFDRPTCRCQLRYFDFPPCAQDASPAEAARRGGLEVWTSKGRLTRIGDVARAGVSGEEFTVDGLTSAQGVPQEVRLQVFVVSGRAYILSASVFGHKDRGDIDRDLAAFFDSFELIRP